MLKIILLVITLLVIFSHLAFANQVFVLNFSDQKSYEVKEEDFLNTNPGTAGTDFLKRLISGDFGEVVRTHNEQKLEIYLRSSSEWFVSFLDDIRSGKTIEPILCTDCHQYYGAVTNLGKCSYCGKEAGIKQNSSSYLNFRTSLTQKAESLAASKRQVQSLIRILADIEVTPEKLWTLFNENQLFFSAHQAATLLKTLKNRDWRHEHVVGCRVIDFWNLTSEAHGVAHCYYSNGPLPQSSDEVRFPVGLPRNVLQ